MLQVPCTDSAQAATQPAPPGTQARAVRAPWQEVLRQVLPDPQAAAPVLSARAVGLALLLLAAAPLLAGLAWFGAGADLLSAADLARLAGCWLTGTAGVAWWLWRSRPLSVAVPSADWLACAAHALRNRLAALGGATDVLGAPAAAPAVHERARAITAQQLRQLSDLAGNLAALADIAGSTCPVRGAPQDLAALAGRALDAQRPRAAAAGQRLLHATQPAWVQGDAGALEQAIAALLRHALRQLRAGAGLVLEVRAQAPEAVLRVRSDGPAPAPVPQWTAMPPDDPDLGLALAQCTVARHGGRLAVAGGADPAIELRLPLRAGPAFGDAPAAQRPAGLRLLLVEDVVGVRDSLAAQLSQQGHAVDAQADGEAGLRSLLADWPDAAVIDLSLPGLTGCALARAARRAGYAGRMVAIAGDEPSLQRSEALQAGFDACLHKPVRPSQLRQALSGQS